MCLIGTCCGAHAAQVAVWTFGPKGCSFVMLWLSPALGRLHCCSVMLMAGMLIVLICKCLGRLHLIDCSSAHWLLRSGPSVSGFVELKGHEALLNQDGWCCTAMCWHHILESACGRPRDPVIAWSDAVQPWPLSCTLRLC